MASIALIHDAAAAEGGPDSSDTLVEAAAIAAALGELGHETVIVPVGLDLAALERRLVELEPLAVFNLVESLEGRGRLLHLPAAVVESLRLPLTGCSSSALALTSHKVLAKRQLRLAGLPTPAEAGVAEDDDHAARWIVKAVWEHASLGIDDSSVVGADALERTLEARRAEYGGEWFAERYVPGRELNVAVIADGAGRPRVLPVAEIRFDDFPGDKPHIVGYAAKWDTASFEYRSTPRSFAVEPALAAQATRVALDCWRSFGLDGYARVDLRVPPDAAPSVLEINANPCLSPDAGFAAALAEAGIGYREGIGWLIEDALRRTGRHAA
jgi:D-alanine-D-alanine ligase